MSALVDFLKRLLDLRFGRTFSDSFEEGPKSFGILYGLGRTLSLCGKPTRPDVSIGIIGIVVMGSAINIHCMSSITNKYDSAFRPRVQRLDISKLPQTNIVGQAKK